MSETSKERLFRLHKELTESAFATMQTKNHDYSGDNGDAFANFRGSSALGIHPVMGIMLRMQDKMQRMRTFVEKGELKVKDESVRDAVEDSINYLVLMYGLMTEDSEERLTFPSKEFVESEKRWSEAERSETVTGVLAKAGWYDKPTIGDALAYERWRLENSSAVNWVAENTGKLENPCIAADIPEIEESPLREWIEHDGGGCPFIYGDPVVEVRWTHGRTGGMSFGVAPASTWDWFWATSEGNNHGDIIAYKVIEEEKPSEWIEFKGGGYWYTGLDPKDRVEVRRRGGSESGGRVKDLDVWGWSGLSQHHTDNEIVAYRIIEKYKGEG